MNVTLLVMYFPPEIGSASHLFYEFAKELVRRGHKVTVVTTFPREYNLNKDELHLMSKYKWKVFLREKIDGIDVIRVRSLPAPRDSPVLRGLEHFFVPLSITLGGLFAKSDVIVVYSPPLPLGLAGWILSKIKRAPLIVNIQDLYPQAAIDLGLLKNPVLIKIFRVIERLVYELSDHITVHSEGNKEYVAEKVPEEKITVIPNWHNSDIRVSEKYNEFRKKLGIMDKFVVTYAGIMSYSQDIETIVDAAALLKDKKDIVFLLVGDGPQKRDIERKVELLGLDNIIMLPFQPKEKYSMLLAASDVCLVTLDANRVKTPVVPRKLNDIMAAGRAVIANVPLDGDVPKIVKEAECGYCIEPKNPEKLAEAILELYNNPHLVERFGKNGAEYARNNFAIDVCCSKYEKLFEYLRKFN